MHRAYFLSVVGWICCCCSTGPSLLARDLAPAILSQLIAIWSQAALAPGSLTCSARSMHFAAYFRSDDGSVICIPLRKVLTMTSNHLRG